jgi:hypothetical protein
MWQLLLQDKKLYSDRVGTSTDSTEGNNPLAVCSKIPRWLRKVKRSTVKLEVYSEDVDEDEYCILIFEIVESSASEGEHGLILELHQSPDSSST